MTMFLAFLGFVIVGTLSAIACGVLVAWVSQIIEGDMYENFIDTVLHHVHRMFRYHD